MFILPAIFLLLISNIANAKTFKLGEYEIKAAFIYNFTKFIEWPKETFADDQTPIKICIVGDDPFGDAFESIQGKTAKGRKMTIERVSSNKDLKKCNIAFISSSEREHISKIVESSIALNILTIADTESYIKKGVVINFIVKDNKVSFAINIDAAKRSELQISSILLRLAKIIRDSNRE